MFPTRLLAFVVTLAAANTALAQGPGVGPDHPLRAYGALVAATVLLGAGGLGLALLFRAACPKTIGEAAERLQKSRWTPLLVGFANVALFATVGVAVAKAVPPLAPVVLGLWFLAATAGLATKAQAVGGRLLVDNGPSPLKELVIGWTAILLANLLPFVGQVVFLFALFQGTGALVLHLSGWGRERDKRADQPPAGVPASIPNAP